MRKQRVGLEHHRGAARHGRKADDVLAADQYLAMSRIFMAGDHAQDRRLAAARRAQKATIGTIGNPEVDAVNDPGGAVITFNDARQFDASVFDIHSSVDSLMCRRPGRTPFLDSRDGAEANADDNE